MANSNLYNALMNTSRPREDTSVLDKLIAAYNNYAYGSGSPLIRGGGNDYVDANGNAGYSRGYALDATPDIASRLGFLSKDVDSTGTTYRAGIDNLAALLGDRNYDNSIETPLGNLNYGYDGDTAYGSVEVPTKQYYAAALLDLLRGR